MEVSNVLRIKLTSDECDTLCKANIILENLQNALSDKPEYEYSKMLFNETQCKFNDIICSATLCDTGNLQITFNDKSSSAPSSADIEKREKRIKELGKKLYKFAEEFETLYDPYRDEKKPTVKEFSKSLYSYKMTAYLMESLLQGMDESGEDLPRYYEVMMDLIHHMEWNDLEKGEDNE